MGCGLVQFAKNLGTSILKMGAAGSFKTLVSNFHITRSDNPKTIILNFCQGQTYLTSLHLLLHSFKWFLITTNLQRT